MSTEVKETKSLGTQIWTTLRGANNEGLLLLIIVVLLLVLQISAPGSISLRFAADIIRSGMVTLALALGLSMVITSGGMDVSFTAIAIFAGYATVVLMQTLGLDGRMWPFLIAALIGLVLGSLNALLVARYRMETLIATLATQVIIRGALIAFVGSAYISSLPAQLGSVGTTSLFHLDGAPVNVLIVPILILAILLWYVLNHTMFGRSIYAIGGDKESARRIGIRVPQVQLGIYLLAGTLAGMAGLTHVVLSQHASPFELVGTELNVIAAVVIGGTPDTGGRGSVKGTILGVILVSVLQNSLIRMGISSYWHTLVIGAVILLCVAVQARTMDMQTRMGKILEEVEV